jgi:hypothetical protein
VLTTYSVAWLGRLGLAWSEPSQAIDCLAWFLSWLGLWLGLVFWLGFLAWLVLWLGFYNYEIKKLQKITVAFEC